MPAIRFIGKVLPSALQITVNNLSPLTSVEVSGEAMELTVEIIESNVSVSCKREHYAIGDDISIMHTRATHVARSVVDCFAFAHGFGLIVFLDQMEDIDGITKRIRLEQPELATHFTAFRNSDGSVDFDAMYRIVATDTDLALAVNDLIAAVTVPGQIAINSARSIEALRNIITAGALDRKKGWQELRETLRLDKSYTEFVTSTSAGPRHGAERYLPTQDDQQEAMKRAWIIMNRFFEYKKRGSQPLPLAEFAILH